MVILCEFQLLLWILIFDQLLENKLCNKLVEGREYLHLDHFGKESAPIRNEGVSCSQSMVCRHILSFFSCIVDCLHGKQALKRMTSMCANEESF